MNNQQTALKSFKYFPLTYVVLVMVFVLSFFSPPETPLSNVSFIDKWTHLVMYGGLTATFLAEYWWANKRKRFRLSRRNLYILGLIAPVILGGLIELGQAYCTGGRRSGEWLDWITDAVGSILAFLICKYILLTPRQD